MIIIILITILLLQCMCKNFILVLRIYVGRKSFVRGITHRNIERLYSIGTCPGLSLHFFFFCFFLHLICVKLSEITDGSDSMKRLVPSLVFNNHVKCFFFFALTWSKKCKRGLPAIETKFTDNIDR